MAEWKKLIHSGSDAELNSLTLSTALSTANGGTGVTSLSDVTGDGKIIVTGGTESVIGGNVTLTVGGDVASGSSLNDIAGLSSADGNFIVGSATGWVVESGATARTSIGLGTSDNVEFANITVNELVNDSTVAGTQLTGSFSGSFTGDGSQLTGLPSAPISSYTNAGDNRIVTSVDATTVNSEVNLKFDGTRLDVTGDLKVSNGISASGSSTFGFGPDTFTVNSTGINVPNLPGGTDDSVVILTAAGALATDEIDSRVWGSSLVDGSGGASRVTYWNDTNSVTSNASFTFDGTDLTVGSSVFGTDVNIAGDLVVQGTASFQHTDSLLVSDKFILLNSGSATGDGGIIIQSGSNGFGNAIGWDDSARRFAFQMETVMDAGLSTMTPDAYVAAVIDVDTAGFDKNSSVHQVAGNIMVSGSEAWIYI
jgi:hypothetical protein